MLHKLKILVMMQLSDKFKLRNNLTFQQKLGLVGKMIFKMGISYGLFILIFLLFFRLLFFPPTVNLFIFVIALMQLIGIMSQTAKLSDSLYMSKDNAILLTYPVPHQMTYISKLVVAYIIELYRSILFIFPIFMAFMTIVPGSGFGNAMHVASFAYVIFSIIFAVLLPLFPVLIGALLSIPVTYIKKGIKKFTILKISSLVLIFAGLSFLTYLIVNYLPDPILILQKFATIANKAENFFIAFNRFTVHVQFVGYVMDGQKIFWNILIILGILAALIALSILISMPLYFKLASSSSEHAVVKNHKGVNKRYKTTFRTFIHKEMLLSIRNIGDFASDYLFLFIMPFVLSFMAAIFMRIERNDLGYAMTYSFIGFITLILLSASSTAAATAISSEGSEFVLLKTAPSNTTKIIWSKLLMNFIVSSIMLTISFVILSFVLRKDDMLGLLWIVYAISIIVSFAVMMWSIQLDIEKPKLKEYAASEKRSDVANFTTSISIGIAVAVVISLMMIVVFLIDISVPVKAMILGFTAIVFALLRLYFLISYTKAYFKDIEL